MTLLITNPGLAALIDWPSLAWVALIGALTFACLTVKARFQRIAEGGKPAEILAHVVVGYYSLGMALFGASAALRAYFPVPGGVGWEGGIAVAGGIAAFVVGATTLYEHVTQVVALRQAERSAAFATDEAR